MRLRCALPQETEELTRPSKKCLRLDNEDRLFVGSDSPGPKEQEKSVRLPGDRLLDVFTKDEQLGSSQCVLRKECGFSSGHIGERAEQKGNWWWFDPTRKMVLEPVKAEIDSLLE